MRKIIRAVPERQNFVQYLIQRLPDAEVVFDTTKNAMDTFVRALQVAGDLPCVHMEDDAILTIDFEAKLQAAIGEHPNNVIQFFSRRKKDVAIGSRWSTWFSCNVCFYLPAGYSAALIPLCPAWVREYPMHPTGYDMVLDKFLIQRHEPHWIHIPNLVEHRVAKSSISSRRSSRRQSKTFIDAWL